MSFRTRLILAFTLLALIQAAFFTLLSDKLLRHGLDEEASERLALVGSLFPRELYESDWPPPQKPQLAWEKRMLALLADYSEFYGLERATLLVDAHLILDSRAKQPENAAVQSRWQADGLKAPVINGTARISGPLYESAEGWHKSLYLKVSRERQLWLRLEVGDQFLGALAAEQRRFYRLALALGLPALLAGLGLAVALSRRARSLAKQLEGSPSKVFLAGKDEFSQLASKIDGLIQSLAAERSLSERLLQSRISQARHLAFGVAHELRNPLAGLSLMCDLLERKSAAGAPASELNEIAGRARAEAARVEKTVARFLEFARTPVLAPAQLDLAQEALNAAKGFRPQAQISGSAQALADPKSAAVIFGVLLGNASEAAGEEGRVEMALQMRSGKACVSIWDSGAPVPLKERELLFTPFHTTKPKGMGLGLATASSLADAMGGRLSILEDGKTFEWVLE